ncbi:hypothetical protein Droror1_Dr00010998 [Drosera rotundifolia]
MKPKRANPKHRKRPNLLPSSSLLPSHAAGHRPRKQGVSIVSVSWDNCFCLESIVPVKIVKLRNTLSGHTGYVNTVAVSPNGSLCASSGNDDVGTIIHALCFSPTRYWLCAATEHGIKIWDLEGKSIVEDWRVDLKQEDESADGATTTHSKKKLIYCTSLSWSADGNTLFSGYTDGVIRVYQIGPY